MLGNWNDNVCIAESMPRWRDLEYTEYISSRGIRFLPTKEVSWVYHKTASDGETLVLDFWEVWSNITAKK